MNATAVILRKPSAGIIRSAFENQASPIRCDIRLVGDELLFRHAEKLGYAGYLSFRHTDYSVRYAAACAAPKAFKQL
jgi:hypothetical protein